MALSFFSTSPQAKTIDGQQFDAIAHSLKQAKFLLPEFQEYKQDLPLPAISYAASSGTDNIPAIQDQGSAPKLDAPMRKVDWEKLDSMAEHKRMSIEKTIVVRTYSSN